MDVPMDALWMWGWVALAILFLIAELFTVGFFLFCFGVGAGASALAAYIGLDPFVQVTIFVLVSGAAVLAVRPLTRRFNERQRNFVGSDRVLDKAALVLVAIDPARGTGLVRVDAEEWRAISASGETIAPDEVVTVLRIEGTRLVVRPGRPGSPASAR